MSTTMPEKLLSSTVFTSNDVVLPIEQTDDHAKFIRNPTAFESLGQRCLSASAGALLTSLFATPLDVAKVRLQARSGGISRPQHAPATLKKCSYSASGWGDYVCKTEFRERPICTATSTVPRPGIAGTLASIARAEGPKVLWSGMVPTLWSAIPSTVLYFATYDYIQQEGSRAFPSLSPVLPIVTGSSARSITACVVAPLELLRTRMMSAEYGKFGIIGNIKLIKQQGLGAAYRGLSATLSRDIPFSAVYWASYENIKAYLLRQPELAGNSIQAAFISGVLSGSLAAIITTPFDVVKTRQQVELITKTERSHLGRKRHLSMTSMLKKIHAEEGIRGLTAGMSPRLAKVAPACAIMITTYEAGKTYFERH